MSTKLEAKRKREDDGNDAIQIQDEVVGKSGQRRGRPRVENRDASAIERRRTQVRVAQRAYRARKDSTISELQAQVAELHKVLIDATTNLQEISDKVAVERDVKKSSVRHDLHQTITRLMEVSKTFDHTKTDSISEGSGSPPQLGLANQLAQRTSNLLLESQDEHSPPNRHVGFAVGQTSSDQSSDHSTYSTSARMSLDASHVAWTNPFLATSSSENPFLTSAVDVSQYIQLPPQVKPSPTFSWQETTFARRLLRHSHEMCLRHIENPTDKYGDVIKRARYSLAFMSQDALITKLKMSVARSTSDPLEDWSMPMLHIGGAGNHFGSNVGDDTMDYRSRFERNVGPFQAPSAAIPIHSSVFPDGIADWLDLGGDWLDPRDVEAYLREKGLNLDGAPSTTVYEIQISPQNDHKSTTLWVNSSSWTNNSTNQSLDFMRFFDESIKNNNLNISTSTRKALAGGIVDVKVRKVLLSIDQLVESLNDKAVCLGRAPGYRQADVDEAFNNVLAKAPEYVVVS